VLLAVGWFYTKTVWTTMAIWAAQACEPIVIFYAQMAAKTGSGLAVSLIVPKGVYDWTHLSETRAALAAMDPDGVSVSGFFQLIGIVGIAFKPLLILIAGLSTWAILHRTSPSRLTDKMSVFDVAQIAKHQFPSIRPAIDANLLEAHPDSGPFAREVSPIRLAIKNKLMKARDKDVYGEPFGAWFVPTFNESEHDSMVPGEDTVKYRYIEDQLEESISKLHGACAFRYNESDKVWQEQLGPLWTRYDDVAELPRALLACFMAFGLMKKEAALAAIDQISATITEDKNCPGKFSADTKLAETLWEEISENDKVQQVFAKHAYVTTVFLGALTFARKKGKLPPARFMWLKLVDRCLWFTLNQHGGQCTWSESVMPRVQYMAEIDSGGPIYIPVYRFDTTATDALVAYLTHSEGWIPLPDDANNSSPFAPEIPSDEPTQVEI